MIGELIKRNLANLLCSQLCGSLLLFAYPIRIPDIRRRGFKFFFKKETTQKRIIAGIFWGFYETKEITIIRKYFNGDSDVIELGSSMGIVSAHLASLLQKNKMLVTVEPNPGLLEVQLQNIRQHQNKGIRTQVYNKALAYNTDHVALSFNSSSTGTTVKKVNAESECTIPAITLSEIVSRHQFDEFTLVCDIEGSEVEIFMNEDTCLEKCKNIFIELHNTTYLEKKVTIHDLVTLITERHHFKQIANRGSVYFFSKNSISPKGT